MNASFYLTSLCLLVTVISVIGTGILFWWLNKRNEEKRREPLLRQLPSGLYLIHRDVILKNNEKVDIDHVLFDPLLMRKLSPRTLSHLLYTLAMERDVEKRLQMTRAVTVAAAFYQFPIPINFLRIDGGTKALYLMWEQFLTLKNVFSNNLNCNNLLLPPKPVVIPIERLVIYKAELKYIGILLMTVANEKGYPSLESFCVRYNTFRNLISRNAFREEEIRILLTAYARITEMMLPMQYMLELNPLMSDIIDLAQGSVSISNKLVLVK